MPDESSNGSRSKRQGGGSPDGGEGARGPRIPRNFVLVILVLLFALAIIKVATDAGRNYQSMSYTDFQKRWNEKEKRFEGFIGAELREDVLLLKTPPKKQGEASADASKADSASPLSKVLTGVTREEWFRVKVPSTAVTDTFLDRLSTIPNFSYEPANRMLLAVLSYTLWLGAFIGLFYFFVIRPLRAQGGPGNVLAFGRSRPKLITKEHTGVRFEDVAGIEEAKEEVKEVIEFLKNPEKFQRLGGRIPRGLLFVGPPGTGKTLLAKAIAGEAGVPFYSISGSDFVEMFVGVGASRVRDLFRQAKENAPCIIFLDEVDAVGRRRGSGLGGGHDEREQTLNAILVEMDGFDTSEQVIVIAATNRPDVLDPALLRPGRFDREVVINLPDLKGRYEILKVHARHIKMADSVDLTQIARGTPMFSGAELEALINEAAIRATMNSKEFVETEDLEEARDKIRYGREKRSMMIDLEDLKHTAYHEAGHAMLSRLLPKSTPLHKVTIIPRGRMAGATMFLPEKDHHNYSRSQLLDMIKVSYGGRIAEEIFFNDVSTGDLGDIQQATDLARRMVCEFGMSDELGPIRYSIKEQQIFLGGEITQPREFSESTAEKIDIAVKRIIEDSYAVAKQMLTEHQKDCELVAKALLKHETLSAEEVEKILQAQDVEAVVKPLRTPPQEPEPQKPGPAVTISPAPVGEGCEPIPAPVVG